MAKKETITTGKLKVPTPKKTNQKPIELGDIGMYKFGRTSVGTPKVEEKCGSDDFILWGGQNDFPQENIRLYQNASELHTRLIKRTADMIYGGGFKPTEQLKALLSNSFSKKKLDKVARAASLNLAIHYGYAIKVIFNKKGDKIVQVENIPVEKLRVQKPQKDENEVEFIDGYYISADWLKKNKEGNAPVWFKSFDPSKSKEYPEQIIFDYIETPGMDFYPLPSFFPIFNFIKLNYEIGVFCLKNAQNNLHSSYIIVNKSGARTQAQRDFEYDALKARYSGADNSGDFLMVYAEPDGTGAPEFIPMQTNGSDKRFIELMGIIDSKIMRAHAFTPALAGIETSGKLGSKNEIVEQLEYLQTTVISPLQKMMEDTFNVIADTNGLTDRFEFIEYKMFKDQESSFLDNLSKQNNLVIQKVLDTLDSNELKEMLGYKPKTNISTEPIVSDDEQI